MLNVTKSIAQAAPLFGRVFKQHATVFSTYLILASAFQLAVEFVFSGTASNLGNWQMQVATGLAQLLTDLAFVLVLAWGLTNHLKKPITWSNFIQQKLGPLVAESLRAIAQILLWALALILPGVYKYTLFAFVSYVVFFEEDYEAGKIDALEFSSQLTKQSFLTVFLVIFVAGSLSFAIEIGPKVLEWTSWPVEMMFSLVGYLFAGFCFALFYLIYEDLKRLKNSRG